jgi:membrane associated rhomboid family serine protease
MKNFFLNNPITSFLSVSIVIIFSLYFTNTIKSVPCETDLGSIFISNFIHTDFLHICSNLYGLYSLSRVEQRIGSKKFFILIIYLLIINTVFETILHKLIKTPCSIGFSGVLYGVLTFELFSNLKSIDITLVSAVVLNIIISKISSKNSSLSGHLIGALTGVIGGLLYYNLYK